MGRPDTKLLPLAFKDADYYLKIGQGSYNIAHAPFVILIHHGSVTKTERLPNMREVLCMPKKRASLIAHDPFSALTGVAIWKTSAFV